MLTGHVSRCSQEAFGERGRLPARTSSWEGEGGDSGYKVCPQGGRPTRTF